MSPPFLGIPSVLKQEQARNTKKTTEKAKEKFQFTFYFLALCCLNCCWGQTHKCTTTSWAFVFPIVSSHLEIIGHCQPSPQVFDRYCSSADYKSAALGCLLKGGSGSRVSEPFPLAPTRQMAPQGFSGCQSAFSLFLCLTPAYFPPPHFTP